MKDGVGTTTEPGVIDHIRAGTTIQGVVARAAGKGIVAIGAAEIIITTTTDDGISAIITIDSFIRSRTGDRIVALAPGNQFGK